jgi:hypothetical protein
MPRNPTNIDHLRSAILTTARELGVQGVSVEWEDKLASDDPNIDTVGGFRITIGEDRTNSHLLSVKQMTDYGDSRDGLIVGSKIAPLGVKVISGKPSDREQNAYYADLTSDTFGGRSSTINRALTGWAPGVEFMGALVGGALKVASNSRMGLGSATFHEALNSLMDSFQAYTGKGQGEGGAMYEAPLAYVIGGANLVDRTRLGVPGREKESFFEITSGKSPGGYKYTSYMSESDYARNTGLEKQSDGTYGFWDKTIGKVISAGRRISRERYSEADSTLTRGVTSIPVVGMQRREYAEGRSLILGTTTDSSFGLGEGRMVGSLDMLRTASVAGGRFHKINLSNTTAIEPGSLNLDQSSIRGNPFDPKAYMLKGGWAQPLGTFGNQEMQLPSSGWRGRKVDRTPMLFAGSHSEAANQLLNAIFGDKQEISVGGDVLNREVAYSAVTNKLSRRLGQSDESFAADKAERQRTLGLVRGGWNQTIKDDSWGDWKKVGGIVFESDEGGLMPQGGEAYHMNQLVWGIAGVLPSGSMKTKFMKGVLGYDQTLSGQQAERTILANERDVNKGPGLLDARHQYWYSSSRSYRGKADKILSGPEDQMDKDTRINKELNRYEGLWRREFYRKNPSLRNNGFTYSPIVAPQTAAEYNAPSRMTFADMERAQHAGIMDADEWSKYSASFSQTPTFRMLTALDENAKTTKLNGFQPMGKEDFPDVEPGDKLSRLGFTLKDKYGWDPESNNKIEVNGLVVPSPSQMMRLKDDRGAIGNYMQLFSATSQSGREEALRRVNADIVQSISSPEARAEIGKAQAEGIYTQYSADKDLAGKNAIMMGRGQIEELFARSGGKEDKADKILQNAKTGDIVGTVFAGREPGQVALSPMNVIYNSEMPDWAPVNISPEFEMLSLGDSDGDPLKIFWRSRKEVIDPTTGEKTYQLRTIDPNSLARRAFGTLASMAGVDETLSYLDKHQRGSESEAEYLGKILMGPDALQPWIGDKPQNVARDRAEKTAFGGFDDAKFSSSDIQNAITRDVEAHGEMGIYNLVQSLRAGLDRGAIDKAYNNDNRLGRIRGVTGVEASGAVATTLGAWYQYPLDLQNIPSSIGSLYTGFNMDALSRMEDGKSMAGIVAGIAGGMISDQKVKGGYVHSPEMIGALLGRDAGEMGSIRDEALQAQQGSYEDRLAFARKVEAGNRDGSTLARVMNVAAALQFDNEIYRGTIRPSVDPATGKVIANQYERSSGLRRTTENAGEWKQQWKPVSEETMKAVAAGRADESLYSSVGRIRRRVGFARDWYQKLSKGLPDTIAKAFGALGLKNMPDEEVRRNAEVISTGIGAVLPEDLQETVKRKAEAVALAGVTPPPRDQAKIDSLGEVGGKVVAVDTESVFQDHPTRSQAVWQMSTVDENGNTDTKLYPVGDWSEAHWGNASPFASAVGVRDGNKSIEALYGGGKLTADQLQIISAKGDNKSGEDYRAWAGKLKEGDIIVGHNITGADDAWLGGKGASKATIMDTLEIERIMGGAEGKNTLQQTMSRRAELMHRRGDDSFQKYATGGNWHLADFDAKATRELFQQQVQEASEMPTEILAALADPDSWQAGDKEVADGYGQRQAKFFKRALGIREARSASPQNASPERVGEFLTSVRNSGRFKGSWIPAAAKGGGPNKAGWTPPGGGGFSGGGTGGGPPPPVGGWGMNDNQWNSFEGHMQNMAEGMQQGNRLMQQMAASMWNVLRGQQNRTNAQYKSGVSGSRNKAITARFGPNPHPYLTSDEREKEMGEYGVGMGRIDELMDVVGDKYSSPSKLEAAGRSLQSARRAALVATVYDTQGKPFDADAIGMARTLGNAADRALERARNIRHGVGPDSEEYEKARVEDLAKRKDIRKAIGASALEAARTANDPSVEPFEKALENLTEKMEKFGKAIDGAGDSSKNLKERLENIKVAGYEAKEAKEKALAIVNATGDEKFRSAMKATIEATADDRGVSPGSVLTEDQGDALSEIRTPRPKAGAAPKGIERLMGGMFLFQMARDWRMTMGPMLAGAEETAQERISMAAQLGMGDARMTGSSGPANESMRRWQGISSGRNYAGYATVSGLSTLLGGRPDLIASNPVIQGIGSAASAGLGGAVALGFAASAMGGEGTALGVALGSMALPVGGILAGIAATGFAAGYGGDYAARAADTVNTGMQGLLGTGASRQVADYLLKNPNTDIRNLGDAGTVAYRDLGFGEQFGRAATQVGDWIGGMAWQDAERKATAPKLLGAGMVRSAAVMNLAMDNNPLMRDVWAGTNMPFEERTKTMSMLIANGVSNTNPDFKRITERIGYGADPNLVMSNLQQIGAAMGTGSAQLAGVAASNIYNTDKSELGQLRFAENFKRLGGNGAMRSRLLAGQNFSSARRTVNMQADQMSEVDDGGMLGSEQSNDIMVAGSLMGMDLTGWQDTYAKTQRNLNAGQYQALMGFMNNDPTYSAIFARGNNVLPGNSWRSATRVDLKNGGAGLFQQSLGGLTQTMDSALGWQRQISGDTQPTGMTTDYVRGQLESIPTVQAMMRQTGVSFTNEDIDAMSGKYYEGKGGIPALQERYARMAYQNQLAGVGIAYQESALSRQFELGVNRPQKDLQLALSGASQFGGSVATPYGQYNATGSFNFQQQNMAFQWQGQQIQYGRQQVQFGWEQQSMDMSRAGQLQGRAMGQFDLGYQRRELDLGHQYFQQDWQFNQQKRQLQFGWQMEDAERNIRRATGFEKQQLIRERGRASEMFNLDSQQLNREKGREEDKYKREDERWRLQLANFQTMAALEDRRWDLERQQLEQRKKWTDEDFQREKDQHARDVAQFNENRALAEINYKQEQERWIEEKKFGDEQFKLQQARLGLQATEIKNAEDLRLKIDSLNTEAITRTIVNSSAMITQMENFFNTLFAAMGVTIPFPRKEVEYQVGPVKAKALGGNFAAGEEILVGDTGPELVRFDRPGNVIPATRTAAMREQSSSSVVENTPVYVTIDGKVIAEAVITHGGDSLRRNTRRSIL